MLCDLIIDGNFILNRSVFTLHKNNLLFGALETSLKKSIDNYKRWYPFINVYLVSDSKEKSWRKKLKTTYKSNRKKSIDIDWEFVFNTYDEFKSYLSSTSVKVLEAPNIEGDDWISYLVNNSNKSKRSCIIVSNDYDIKQLVKFSLDPLIINIMSNEIYNKQKIFLPKNYKIFLDTISKIENDIFNLNYNKEFLEVLYGFIKRYQIEEVDAIESLIVKLISGDSSDNIQSAWTSIKNGRKRGIADKGAKSIFDEYIINFGEPKLRDPDLTENIADLICEKKKLSKSQIVPIKENLEENIRLICLEIDSLPKEVVSRMEKVFLKL